MGCREYNTGFFRDHSGDPFRQPATKHHEDSPPKIQNVFVSFTWVVVRNMAPFWIPIIIRHLIFRVPKRD